jgi:hypothetical protein
VRRSGYKKDKIGSFLGDHPSIEMSNEELKALAMWYEQIDDEALVDDVSSEGHSESDSEYHNPVFDETASNNDVHCSVPVLDQTDISIN